MANKYWVGSVSGSTPASGNWSSTTGWRTTSGGSIITTPPGTSSSDVAIFDNNSFLGAAITVTVDSAISIAGLDASGITTGANGITLASSGAGAIEMRSGSSLTLPASRFTWTMTGALTVRSSSTSTWTTNGVAIASPISTSASTSTLTLGSNLNCTNTFTSNGGTINFGSYQLFCTTATVNDVSSTWNATTQGAGITITSPSGTVLTWPGRAGRPSFSAIKPAITFTTSDPSVTTGRTVSWTGTGHYTTTSTTPGFVFTNGSDTVIISIPASSAYFNFGYLNTTGFAGTIGFNNGTITTGYLYIFGDIIITPSLLALTSSPTITMVGAATTSSKFSINNTNLSFSTIFLTQTATYVQQGNVNFGIALLTGYPYTFTTGSFVFNTGSFNGGYNILNNTSFVGDIVIGGSITLVDAFNFSSCTSITFNNNNTSGGSSIRISLTASSNFSAPLYFTGVNASSIYFESANLSSSTISFSNSYGTLYFTDSTITNTVTFSSFSVGAFYISNSTISSTVNLTCRSFYVGPNSTGAINIPSTSVVNITGNNGEFAVYNSATSVTNKFTVNLITVAGNTNYLWCISSTLVPNFDVYISGNGAVVLDNIDGNSYYPRLTSLDTSSYTGGSISGTAYIANSLVQSATYPAPFDVVTTGTSGTFTLNSTQIKSLASTSSVTVSIIPSTVYVNGNFTVNGIFNSGTATIIFSSGSGSYTINIGTQKFYNVVLAGLGNYGITASYFKSLTNTTQPLNVYFYSDVTFGTFGLNGTAGNLVTVTSNATTQRTLTKSTAWNLDNSTNGGNNNGLTFGSTGNNSYLNISYINGVFLSTATANFLMMFF